MTGARLALALASFALLTMPQGAHAAPPSELAERPDDAEINGADAMAKPGKDSGAQATASTDSNSSSGRVPLGPLWVSEAGRYQMRGDRGPDPSLYAAFTPPARRAEYAVDLFAFEQATFSPEQAPEPMQTLKTRPPEGWMSQLAVPPGIPIRWNRALVEYLEFFHSDPKGQAMIKAWFRRKHRYEAAIKKIFAQQGVPEELLFVALAESGFHPGVRSDVGAAGMWQFMVPTGQVYGLQVDEWIDDRHDFERSTWAAAAYLHDLKVRFGNWELALAAYNAGYGNVMTAMRRNNTNNFWALCEIENGLPHATTLYPPKILAAAVVQHNRRVFGVADDQLKLLDSIATVEVRVPPGTSIKELATSLQIAPDLMQELNARYVRGRTPPTGEPAMVRIPSDKFAAFERESKGRDALAQRYTSREVLWGESLESIASQHGITEKALRSLNGLTDSAQVGGGSILVVPRAQIVPTAPIGDKPLAAVPTLPLSAGQRVVFVRATRSLAPSQLAERMGTTWERIAVGNDLDPLARLQDGQILQVAVAHDFVADAAGVRVFERDQVEYVIRGSSGHLDAELRRRNLVRRGHRVKRGDTLDSLAKRYGLSVGSIARINQFPRTHQPQAGDLLVVYVEPNKTKGTVVAPETTVASLLHEISTVDQNTVGPSVNTDPSESPPPAQGGVADDAGQSSSAPSTAQTSKVPGRRRRRAN